jgi:hypothetical protein
MNDNFYIGATPEVHLPAWREGPCSVCNAESGCLCHGKTIACRWKSSNEIRQTRQGTFYLHGPDAPRLPEELPPARAAMGMGRTKKPKELNDPPRGRSPAMPGRREYLPQGQPHDDITAVAEKWPAPPDVRAYHGLAGEIVRVIEPHTEADPVALLVQVLVAFGNVIGKSAYFMAEASRHYLNLFAVLVGATSKGRKGSSWSQACKLFQAVDPRWVQERAVSGLSSGEGLIWAVRDPIKQQQPVKEKGRVMDYQEVEVDPGIADKRLLTIEPEFASVLAVMGRERNTLSAIIRQAWDSGNLRTLTKTAPAKATGAHISIIGHITRDELRRNLADTERSNGFGNRFLWLGVRRSKALPEGGRLEDVDLAPLVERLQEAIEFAKQVERMQQDDNARAVWADVYPALSEGKPGMLGAMLSRAEAQVMRLACIYALLDKSSYVRAEHLTAALALWEYCEVSTRYIFGDATGDRTADEIMSALRASPGGLTQTDIRDLFGRNRPADEIGRALQLLMGARIVYSRSEETDGRSATRWFAGRPPTTETT